MAVIIWWLFSCVQTHAADAYDLSKVVALEERQYWVNHDLTVKLGTYPLDSFNKSYVGGLSYAYMFKPYWGWEIVDFQWARNQSTGLKSDLINNFGVAPQGILDYISWVATTNLVYTPIYAKNLWFNSRVIYSEMSFVVGAGTVNYNSGDHAMAFGGGAVARYFLSQRTSLKFDGRLYYDLAQDKNSNLILMLNVGLAFQLGSSKQ